MKFEITNIVADGNTIIAFYRYEDGTEHSNRFVSTAAAIDILNWGKTNGDNIVKAREDAVRRAQELIEILDVGEGL